MTSSRDALDLLDELGADVLLAAELRGGDLGDGQGGDGGFLELAGLGIALEGGDAELAMLVSDEDEALVRVGAEAEHAGHDAAGRDGVREAELGVALAALLQNEVRDAVGFVATEAVGDVDVTAVVGDGELARGRLVRRLWREARAIGAQAMELGELEAVGAGAVLEGEEDQLVRQLRGDDVVRGLLAAVHRDEAAVAGAGTGAGGGGPDDVVVGLGVDDQDGVAT